MVYDGLGEAIYVTDDVPAMTLGLTKVGQDRETGSPALWQIDKAQAATGASAIMRKPIVIPAPMEAALTKSNCPCWSGP